jgi:hypothetical protein
VPQGRRALASPRAPPFIPSAMIFRQSLVADFAQPVEIEYCCAGPTGLAASCT